MDSTLDTLMYKAWQRIESRVLSDEIELRRRLDRRSKIFNNVPRALAIAIRASDRRITPMNAWLSVRDAMVKGNETEHDVLLAARTIKDLCRPVELYWGQRFRKLADSLGTHRQVACRLEQRGILRARRIALLGGQRGLPVPVVDSPVSATASPGSHDWEDYGCPAVLDPCCNDYTAPDKLLRPYWEGLSFRVPDWFEQMIRRKPVFRVQRRRLRFMHWVWVCPECKRERNTLYLPLGAPDFARMHGIELPKGDSYDEPEQRLCLGCWRCQGLFGLSWTKQAMSNSWGALIAHMSGGLLYGQEVKRPASLRVVNKHRATPRARPAPRRDEIEGYLAQTELSLAEIARRMEMKHHSVATLLCRICKKRGVRGRSGLREWWSRHAAQGHRQSAA